MIVGEGASARGPFTVAITGGTGRYAGARGVLHATPTNRGGTRQFLPGRHRLRFLRGDVLGGGVAGAESDESVFVGVDDGLDAVAEVELA